MKNEKKNSIKKEDTQDYELNFSHQFNIVKFFNWLHSFRMYFLNNLSSKFIVVFKFQNNETYFSYASNNANFQIRIEPNKITYLDKIAMLTYNTDSNFSTAVEYEIKAMYVAYNKLQGETQ